MAAITIRNIPEETHRALKRRAKENGRSTESEVREILERAVRPSDRNRLGTELGELGRRYGGWDIDLERDRETSEGADFGEAP